MNRPVTNCSVWAALQTMGGTMVFCSCDYDADQGMLGDRQPGIYEAEFVVPKEWLNFGEYVVVVGVVRNNPVEVFNREETVVFEIEEIGMPSAVTGTEFARVCCSPCFHGRRGRSIEGPRRCHRSGRIATPAREEPSGTRGEATHRLEHRGSARRQKDRSRDRLDRRPGDRGGSRRRRW